MIVWGVGAGDILLSITGAGIIEHQILKEKCCRYHPVQYPAARAQTRGGLKEGREGEENTVALKEQQKIPRRRRNEIGNADYIHKRMTE